MTLSRLRAVWLCFFFLFLSFSSAAQSLEELLEDPKFTRTGYVDLTLLREKAEGFLVSLHGSSSVTSKDLKMLEKLCLAMARQTGLGVSPNGFILDRRFHRRFAEAEIGQFYSIPRAICARGLDSQYLTDLQNRMRIRSESSVKDFPMWCRSIPRDHIYGIADVVTTVAAAVTPSMIVTPEWFANMKCRLSQDILIPSDCFVLTVMPEQMDDVYMLLEKLAAARLKVHALFAKRTQDMVTKYPILSRVFRDPYLDETVAIESWAPLLKGDKKDYERLLGSWRK